MGFIMKSSMPGIPVAPRMHRKFKESLCAAHMLPARRYTELAWRLGSSRLTNVFRPLLQFLSPTYFQADDDCLDAIAECHLRSDVLEEIRRFEFSYLRRGVWRYFGVGLSGYRLLKEFDRLITTTAVVVPSDSISALDQCDAHNTRLTL